MNIFESIKSNLNLITYPNSLWAAHVDSQNSCIAILHLNPHKLPDFVSIDKAVLLHVVNDHLKTTTTMNNEKVSVPQLNYNVQTFSDVSNMLFAFDNYPIAGSNNLPLNMNLLNFPLDGNNMSTKLTNTYFTFSTPTTASPVVAAHGAIISEAQTPTTPTVPPPTTKNYEPKLLTCEYCNKTSKNRGTHYKHLQTHVQHKPYLCSVCGKSFRTSSHLSEHFVTHAASATTTTQPSAAALAAAAKRVPCELCHKTFSTASNLKAHIKTHSGERHHVCGTCGKAYTTSSNLQTHIRSIHQDDKPYACGGCDMRFVHPRALRLHMLKHTKERPFKCTFCEKSFPKKVHLTVHVRSHTGEKPYACTTCGKCFATSGNLKAHVKMH